MPNACSGLQSVTRHCIHRSDLFLQFLQPLVNQLWIEPIAGPVAKVRVVFGMGREHSAARTPFFWP